MKVDVRFSHMDRSEALEENAIAKVETALANVLRRDSVHAQIWLVCDHSKYHDRGEPEYRCEIEVRYPPRKDCFVSKTDADIHVALQGAVSALKASLRDGAKRNISAHRQAKVMQL